MRVIIKYSAVLYLLIMLLPEISFGFDSKSVHITGIDTVTVTVLGTSTNSRFEPSVVEVSPGDVVRFMVKEGVHTVTAYHPDNRRDLGIPRNAESFDSGILAAGSVWYLTVTHEGEYNYFCMPHERLGHIGKIISKSAITHLK